jgi:hypothetical protein
LATDATGSPTSLGIPKFNTSADAPSGLGSNAQMDAIDTLLAARVVKPSGIVSGEVPVWNGTTWVRSSVTKLASGNFGPVVNADIDAAAAIAYSKMNNPGGTTTFLRADGTFATPASGVYDRVTSTVDIANSNVEASMYSKSIAANDMSTNKMLRLTLIGDYLFNNNGADTFTLRIKFGGTTFFAHATSFGGTIGANRQPWHMYLMVANLGAANSQMIEGQLIGPLANVGAPTTGIGNLNVASGSDLGAEFGISTLGTIDTTAAKTLDVTAQWSATSANDSFRTRYALLELV